MTLTCTKCQRTNPGEATFCYYDGHLLPGAGRGNGGPLNAGALRFAREFVFPSGRRCHSFDELSVACIQDRPQAADLLQQGFLESFLGGIGRADLALMARQAAKFPDRMRGLDMLVERFPSRVVSPPKLLVEPLTLNLGQLQVGDDRCFPLHLTNQGMRLLYGTVSVEKTPWLALGTEPGVPEKSFDCEDELEMPVLVRGKKLRGDRKPQEGRLLVESNGGTSEVVVKVEVPVLPFPAGAMAGVVTRRQLAEQAFKSPKEASPLFENGEVARWYAANGWLYPVQGPTATGIAALQQFLEACGLTQAPRLEVEPKTLNLTGAAGDRLEARVQIKTGDRKPVFGYAVSDQAWLVPRKAVLTGTLATIPLEVPSVPYGVDDKPLAARLTVVGNGRQKFTLPVTLNVTGGIAMGSPAAGEPRLDEGIELFAAQDDAPPLKFRRPAATSPMMHALPAALLLLVLLGIVLLDFRASPSASRPLLPEPEKDRALDNTPYLRIEFSNQEHHRFGLRINQGEDKDKKLTFQPDGRTNNTCLRIDERDFIFGQPPGAPGAEHRSSSHRPIEYQSNAFRTTWEYFEGEIQVLQDISLRRTDQTEKLETCLVRYVIRNRGKESHRVGLRFMLDTFIGQNDGVPFTVPGKEGLCDTQLEFKTAAEIPDFIQALERPNLENRGVVAHLTLKAGRLEPPSRLLLSGWPDPQLQQRGLTDALGPSTRWDVPLVSMKDVTPNDSAVIMYWEEKDLAPGQQRELGFAYGLGQVAVSAGTTSGGTGKLALTVDGSFRPGGEFTVTAYVTRPDLEQTATLALPEGLKLVEGQFTRQVPPAGAQGYSPVTWKVRANQVGAFDIAVRSGNASQSQRVKIVRKSFLD